MPVWRLFTRAIRPPDDVTPNANDPAGRAARDRRAARLLDPGDPDGVVIDTAAAGAAVAAAADHAVGVVGLAGRVVAAGLERQGGTTLTDTAWTVPRPERLACWRRCRPYLVGAAPTHRRRAG